MAARAPRTRALSPVAAALAAVLLLGPAATAGGGAREDVGVSADVRLLAAELERTHPNLFHDLSRQEWQRAVERLATSIDTLGDDERLIELMRVAALPGVRDGHTGLYPLLPHRRRLHLLPIQLYDFRDGLHVVASPRDRRLVGKRVVAIGGVPVERVVAEVSPLIGRDNDWSRRARVPEFVLVTEVLHGLGLVFDAGSQRLSFGDGTEAVLAPVDAAEWAGEFGRGPLPRRPRPTYLSRAERDWWTASLDDGRIVHAAYTSTQSYPAFVARLRRLTARPAFRRLILDLRLNGGGNNTQYGELLALARSPRVNRRGRFVVLAGRHTFSAAGNLAADLDRSTLAIFVGEPTGGAPNQYGDATLVRLPQTGWAVRVATVYHEFGTPRDRRLAIPADLRVEPTAADFLAGRDPVLEAARRLPLNPR
jgi:hypothetical protein